MKKLFCLFVVLFNFSFGDVQLFVMDQNAENFLTTYINFLGLRTRAIKTIQDANSIEPLIIAVRDPRDYCAYLAKTKHTEDIELALITYFSNTLDTQEEDECPLQQFHLIDQWRGRALILQIEQMPLKNMHIYKKLDFLMQVSQFLGLDVNDAKMDRMYKRLFSQPLSLEYLPGIWKDYFTLKAKRYFKRFFWFSIS